MQTLKLLYLKYTCIVQRTFACMHYHVHFMLYNVLPSWIRKAALISLQANIHFTDNTT